MSYILDALKRAQAERGRGSVPGLHTQSVTVPSAKETPEPRSGHRGAWLIAGAAGVAALALAWLQFGPKGATHQPVVVAQVPAAVPAPAPTPAPVAIPEPVPTPAPAPVVVKSDAPAPIEIDVTPPPPPPPAPPKPVAQPTPTPTPAAAKREEAAARQAKMAAPADAASFNNAAPAPAPAPVAAAPAAPVYNVANLPPAVREQLPSLQLAGITYSTNPKYRMVIVNGQVLHEGDSAGPGLVLERIENARTIWAFRGYRYALP
ncbi:general secretion pathway protein GspB [Diaphorobacter sp. HDW4B]|uniref:general secretion pathway protein GspB n=1 Tax=Diaphorobacter sp. HDW4B TaxID=2714925 RepID=UPI00140DADE6|nr:general secretion pathway protein GspB [Diaphorobacter sp. HDW4B]QIL70330.1 general secretion pathway protein GspB [Diaphorobacter sp. HDW4B]